MPFSAGDFTASALHGEVLARIDELLVNDTTKKDLINDTSIINELYTHPTVTANTPEQVQFFTDARRCANLKLSWLVDGDEVAPIAATNLPFCDIDGPEIGSDSATYAKPVGISKSFKVLDGICKDKFSFAEKVAYSFMSKRSKLIKQLEKNGAAFLVANADDLSATSVPKGAVATTLWNIGAVAAGQGQQAVKDMIHIQHYAEDQDVIAPVVVAGNRFRYEDAVFKATAGQACGTENVGSLLTGGMKIIRDVRNMDTATSGNQDLFVVDKAAIAHINYTYARTTQAPQKQILLNTPITFYYNDPVLRVWDPVTRSIVPYKWDIVMMWKCSGEQEYAVVYQITGRSGFLKMPKDYTNKPQIIQVRFADAA